jgi:hypothetical protein
MGLCSLCVHQSLTSASSETVGTGFRKITANLGFGTLERFPTDLNRSDSQGEISERFYRH